MKQPSTTSTSLNKYISDTGFCSRREADDYIAQGRVTINEALAEKGNRVYDGDVVEIDGEPIKKNVKTIYIAFNKPKGITSTTDTKDRTNIISYIHHKQRIFPVGRLDKDSEGLIFLTNDGNIVNKILRAGNEHEKEYIVTVDQPITPEFLKNMREGVRILKTKTKPCKVVQESKYVFRITLIQGLNRQIRRMCMVLGFKVKKLIRIRIMNVGLGKLPVGHWRYLTPEEITTIQRLVKSSIKTVVKKAGPPKAEEKNQSKKNDKEDLEAYIKAYEAQKNKKPKKQSYKHFRKGK